MRTALNTSLFAKSVFVPAILALTALSACQEKIALIEICAVTSADIEGLQSAFRARFNEVAEGLPETQTLNAKPLPSLKKPFEATVKEKLTAATDDPDAPINYSWRVGLTQGCSLEARLGTNTEAAPKDANALDVKALSLTATKSPDGIFGYAPIALILNK